MRSSSFWTWQGSLGLGELNVGTPQLLVVPIVDVATHHVVAFRAGRPSVEDFVECDLQAKAGRTISCLQADLKAGGRALVALQDAADLAIDLGKAIPSFYQACRSADVVFGMAAQCGGGCRVARLIPYTKCTTAVRVDNFQGFPCKGRAPCDLEVRPARMTSPPLPTALVSLFPGPVAQARLGRLYTGLQARTVVPYIGAGMSRCAGYPTWGELCDYIRKKALPGPDLPASPPPAFASLLEHYCASELELSDLIERRFAPVPNVKVPLDAPVACLVRLSPSLIVTTNYDSVLEQVFGKALDEVYTGTNIDSRTYRRLVQLALPGRPSTLLKLHGSYDLDAGLVATHSQYQRAYRNPGRNQKLLEHLMSSRSMLFLGCSLDEQDAPTKVLLKLRRRLGEFAQEHFAVRRRKSDTARQEERRLAALGIKTLFYEGSDPDDALRELLGYLASAPAKQPASAPIAEIDLSLGRVPLLALFKQAPEPAGSLPPAWWHSLVSRIETVELSSDLQVWCDPVTRSLELECQRGFLVEKGRQRANVPMTHPVLPILYGLPQQEFKRQFIKAMELSFDVPNHTLRIIINHESVFEILLKGAFQ